MNNLKISLVPSRKKIKENDIELWPTFDEMSLTEKTKKIYNLRKKGVYLYVAGASDEKFRDEIGLSKKQIYRLITERCIQIHPDGKIYGWRGLIPNINLKKYTRIKQFTDNSNDYSGILNFIFENNPTLKEKFDSRILKPPSKKRITSLNINKKDLWKWLLTEFKLLGFEVRNEWPFNTQYKGYITIIKYINKIRLENPEKTIKINSEDSFRKIIAGDGVNRPVTYPFNRVEMDAHKIDGRFCILIPDLYGNNIPTIIHRIWVIVLIDVFSRAVLGYHISYNKEVTQEDTLKAIRKSLSVWIPKKISLIGMSYKEKAGFPSSISEKFVGVGWDETCVDGAMAENSHLIEKVLNEVVESKLISPKSSLQNYTKRNSKDDRPYIESFFKQLAANGFQRLNNTTGKDHQSKVGRNPEKIALQGQFQVEYAEELIDVIIANYNATPHTGLNYQTPLEFLEKMAEKNLKNLRYVSSLKIQNILSYRKKCKVNGDLKKGRAPFVNFAGAKYTNEILRQRYDLVGKYIWVINHIENDSRIALSSTLQGDSLGILRVGPPWDKLPHSLYVRKIINTAKYKKILDFSNNNDAISTFLNYCETNTKLPIHPAYLEARRILIENAEEQIGESILERAKDNYKQKNSKSKTIKNKRNEISEAKQIPIEEDIDSEDLPKRRKVRQ
ncbi:hypothetical protein [Acinetobacter pittii]|uniref:hypothetical protein n=1 Tax=Acinetobacter pittii TaxID=48296 RepID=UPI00177D3C58